VDLYNIEDPNFLNELSTKELQELSEEIRQFIIDKVSKTGGHLSSNLGVVELTVALHRVFDSPKDKLIFDVGHQAYTHKILTGRAKEFDTLRKYQGLSGYLKRSESPHDIYEAGHSSTSIAAAAGIEFSKKYTKDSHKIIPIIGDGALTGGMAFEALNFLGGNKDHQPIIILNDNEMSISENIGYLSNVLNEIRGKVTYRKLKTKTIRFMPKFLRKLTSKVERGIKGFLTNNTIFDDLGFSYYGPINGHNMKELIKYLEIAKKANKPCVIHVLTVKGKGYKFSENEKTGTWHGVSPFNKETGLSLAVKEENILSWSEIIAHYMSDYARKNEKFTIVVPAMIGGSGLLEYQKEFPNRIIDVGIAEQMAVTMSSGFAIENVDVFVPLYSTFLQRAYDQVNHDVARQNLKVVFGIDRAGVVGADGETHQGIYDIPLLRHIPNMTITHPRTPEEAYELLNYGFKENTGPFVIRYERGTFEFDKTKPITDKVATLKWDIINEGNDLVFIAFGSILNDYLKVVKEEKLSVKIVNAKTIKPLDKDMINQVIKMDKPIIIYEESALLGGFGSSVLEYLTINNLPTKHIHLMGIGDEYVNHGSKKEILAELKLDVKSTINKTKELIK
jgi:1-deoxy-D-xylulose-5-phosphate synthase